MDTRNRAKILGQEHRRLLAIIDYLEESKEQLEQINNQFATRINNIRTDLINLKDNIHNTKENLEYMRKWDKKWNKTIKNESTKGS